MARYRTGVKPLHQSMITKISDAAIHVRLIFLLCVHTSFKNSAIYIQLILCASLGDHLTKVHSIAIQIRWESCFTHYSDVIMGAMASQITRLTIVYSTVYSGADQRKHQSSASLAFVRGIHRWPVNSQHNWQVPREMFPFGDVIMCNSPPVYDIKFLQIFTHAMPAQLLYHVHFVYWNLNESKIKFLWNPIALENSLV